MRRMKAILATLVLAVAVPAVSEAQRVSETRIGVVKGRARIDTVYQTRVDTVRLTVDRWRDSVVYRTRVDTVVRTVEIKSSRFSCISSWQRRTACALGTSALAGALGYWIYDSNRPKHVINNNTLIIP